MLVINGKFRNGEIVVKPIEQPARQFGAITVPAQGPMAFSGWAGIVGMVAVAAAIGTGLFFSQWHNPGQGHQSRNW